MSQENENIALTEAVYYILLSLYEPLHGYGIMQKIEELSDGRVLLAAGTLYGALSTLVERGWIEALPGEKNSRRKEYVILPRGKAAVENELRRLRELLANGELIAGGKSKMKHVVYKVFWAWDFEKEEKWLNEMAAQGLLLTDVGGCRYVFQEGAPGEYRYHLEWLQHFPSHPESIAYIKFVEETGAEHVGSFKKWVYFRKKAAEGAFSLFSDLDSRITHFRRITQLIGLLSLGLLGYVGSLALHCLRLEYVSEPYVCMFGVYAVMLTLFGVGFFKALGTYRALKRKRIVQE